jgi:hypothetical protein
VDTATLALRAREGVLHLDSLEGVAGGIAVRGRGALAIEEGRPAGSVELAFQSDSLGRLRPLVLGDLVIARDTLTALDRELLLAEDIDPDTLPTRAEVAVGGSVRGELTLSGSVREFAARGSATFARLRFGSNVARGATVTIDATGLPSLDGRIVSRIQADSVTVYGREYARAELDLDYARPSGRVEFALRRDDTEDYSGRAVFEATRADGTVELEALALRFDGRTWSLQSPAVISWNDADVRVDGMVIASPGDSVRIEVDGLVPRQGSADLRVSMTGLPLVRLASLAQERPRHRNPCRAPHLGHRRHQRPDLHHAQALPVGR